MQMKNKKIFVYGGLMAKHKDKQTAFPAYLKGYKVSFEVKGLKPFEPSFATLTTKINSKAYGIIITLSESKLKNYIAHEISYETKNIVAIDMKGTPHECIALFLKKPGYKNEVSPSARYAHQLHKGGKYHELPEEVLNSYLKLKKNGNKFTYYLRFLFPLYLKCIPWVGRYIAFYGIMIFLPLGFLATLIILISKYII